MRLLTTLILLAVGTAILSGDDSGRLLTVDHFVRVKSTVPAIAGQQAQLYVRERVLAGMVARGTTPSDRVVLFVHGAGTPAEVAFDVSSGDYSWMAYLAGAGFDVFSVDMTGYGRSTRPAPMNDPCNLAENQRPQFLGAPCTPSYPYALTNIGSDWNDVSAAVDYIRLLRRVDRVSLVAWSLGGPRAGGYAAQNPSKVNRLVVLARPTTRRVHRRRRSFPPTARRSILSRAPSSTPTGTARSGAPINMIARSATRSGRR
jgi:pimeloyl-ACP methyl ester carboxylesterase